MQNSSAPVRTNEGSRPTGAESRNANRGDSRTVNKGGRPVGSKNKPKSLIPTELANEMLLVMKDQVPPEHFKYLQGVIRDGKAISTKTELDTMILLLSRNLYPALIRETEGEQHLEFDEDGTVLGQKTEIVFRKDVTERLKVLNSLLTLRNQIEKREDEAGQGGNSPVLKVWASRGMQDRVAVLIGPQQEQPLLVDGHAEPA